MDEATIRHAETRRTADGVESPARRQVLQAAMGTGMLLLLPMLSAYGQNKGGWTAVGKAAQFPVGQPQRAALADGGVLWVTRVHAAQLVAVSAKCTHHGCEVRWNKDDHQFLCPCHGAAFAEDGKNLHGPRRSPQDALPALPSVPVRQKNGQVEVNLTSVPPATVEPEHRG